MTAAPTFTLAVATIPPSNQITQQPAETPGGGDLVQPTRITGDGGDSVQPTIGASVTPEPTLIASATFVPTVPVRPQPTSVPIIGGDGSGGSTFVGGNGLVDVSSSGRTATASGGQVFVNGGQITFLTPDGRVPQVYIADLRWSRDGRYLAIVGKDTDPNGGDGGVWIYDAQTGTSHQIMQKPLARVAESVEWSPDGVLILIKVTAPEGNGYTILDKNAQPGDVWVHYFEDATWSVDGREVIVSGLARDRGNSVTLGRIRVYEGQSYLWHEYGGAGINWVRAATELPTNTNPRSLAFLGAAEPSGPWYLYVTSIGAAPRPVAGPIPGWLISWEWNKTRSGLMVVAGGRLWIATMDGTVRDITPAGGVPRYIHWR